MFMEKGNVVIAHTSRLLRGMLERAIKKSPSFYKNIQLVADLSDLPGIVDETRPTWMVVSLSTLEEEPAMVQQIMKSHPETNILGMTMDGSESVIWFLTIQEQELGKLTFPELVEVLKKESVHVNQAAVNRHEE
jgi:hypothetical protein